MVTAGIRNLEIWVMDDCAFYTLHLLCETTAQCAGFHKAPQCVQIRVAYIAQRLGLS